MDILSVVPYDPFGCCLNVRIFAHLELTLTGTKANLDLFISLKFFSRLLHPCETACSFPCVFLFAGYLYVFLKTYVVQENHLPHSTNLVFVFEITTLLLS